MEELINHISNKMAEVRDIFDTSESSPQVINTSEDTKPFSSANTFDMKKEIGFRETGIIPEKERTSYKKGNANGTLDLGTYGINEATLKTYGKDFLGKNVTAKQLLASQELQDKFITAAQQHLDDLGVIDSDMKLALWRKGWGNLEDKRLSTLLQDPDVVKYLNNKPK